MKSIVNYGLFATALATAAFLGHTFTERGYNLKAKQLATKMQDLSELKENSRSSDSQAASNTYATTNTHAAHVAHNSLAAARSANAGRSSDISPGSIAFDLAAIGRSKASQQTEKMSVVRRPESSPAEPVKKLEQDNKKLSTSSRPPSGFNEATSTSIASVEMIAGSDRVNTLPEPVADNPVSGLDMLAILAPLLKLTDGKPLGAEAIENKTVLVAVWASWCSSCQRQLQALDELEKRLNNPRLQIIVLAVDEDIAAMRGAVERRSIHQSVVILDKNASKQLQLQGLPSIYIADARGKLRSRLKGSGSEEIAIAEQQIVALLAETKMVLEKPVMISRLAGAEVGANL